MYVPIVSMESTRYSGRSIGADEWKCGAVKSKHGFLTSVFKVPFAF